MSIASLYPSINPSLLLDFANSKVLDPRITFTRTTTATYYDGVTTAKAEENLLTYSQDFSNAAWTKLRSSVTADSTTAPDGTTTADSLIEDTSASDSHQTTQSITTVNGSTYTYSVYIKPNGRTWAVLNLFDGTNYRTWFDLTGAGAVGTNAAGTTASITAVGTWYRCVITRAVASTSTIAVINLANADNSYLYTGNGTSGVYLWGAQLEQRSSATAYTATTTQAITNYIPVLQTAAAGQARFDHNPTTGESLGLLIEEARTNLVQRSSEFNNGYWQQDNTSIDLNTIVAPDGTLTGDKMKAGTSSGQCSIYNASPLTFTAQPYTWSVYAKAGDVNWLGMSAYDVAHNRTWFNLSNGTVGTNAAGNTATITAVGNGWYRCTVSRTASATSAGYWQVYAANADNVLNPGTTNGFSGIFIWGAQLEAGSFATSYIPTVASTVTRNADAASMTGTNFSSWFNNGEGTIYSEAITGPNSTSVDSDGDSIGVLCISDGTNNNRIRHAVSITTLDIRYSGSQVVSISSGTYVSRTAYRSASAYKTNDFQFSNNGTLGTADTSGNVPPATTMQIGASGITSDAGSLASGSIKKIAYYPIRVTNAQLQALTV